jgi:two-component system KDP operon response regulator KdpE
MQKRILIIDDDQEFNHLLTQHLEAKGFEVCSATSAQEGLKAAYLTHPDLVILDIMMPEMDGWQACKRLREVSDVPIIMLTAKIEDDDVVQGFLLGADDYIRKPFSVRELEVRIHAVLRRSQEADWVSVTPYKAAIPPYDDGTLRIEIDRQRVLRNGRVVRLTPTEFRLLSYLVRHRERVVTHEELLADVWGSAYLDATDCLSIYIHYLREKLEENPREPAYIRTKWGVGYWFAPPKEAEDS